MSDAKDLLDTVLSPVPVVGTKIRKKREERQSKEQADETRQARGAFRGQVERTRSQERAKALQESIKRRKLSGTAIRRLGTLGRTGNGNSSSNSSLG